MIETDELPVEGLVPEVPEIEEKRDGGKLKFLATGAAGVAVLAIAAAVTVGMYGQSQVDAARKGEHKAQAEAKALRNQPPKTVTKTVTKKVPTFGKSTLMGIFASGAIQQGTYDSAGNQVFTPNDSTCSDFYTSLSNQYTSIAIDRGEFMQACLTSVTQTLRKNTTP
ncbi:hypothetical protein ACWCY6_44520 [Streptomyces sp. 900105755]